MSLPCNHRHLPPWQGARLEKRARYRAMAEPALADLDAWIAARRVVAV